MEPKDLSVSKSSADKVANFDRLVFNKASTVDSLSGQGAGDVANNVLSREDEATEALKAHQKMMQGKRQERTATDRSALEAVGDTAISIAGQGPVAVAQGLYETADLASKITPAALVKNIFNTIDSGEFSNPLDNKSLDDLVGLSDNFNKTHNALEGFKSEGYQENSVKFDEGSANRQSNVDAAVADRVAKGENETLATIIEEGANIGDAISAYADNPALTFDKASQSLAHFVGPGGIAALAKNVVFKNMDEVTKAAFLKSPEGKKALNKISTKSGVGYTALSEGGTAAGESKNDILNTPTDDLYANSEAMRELVDNKNMSPEEARKTLASRAQATTFATTGILAGAISKFTGAGKFEADVISSTTDAAKKGTASVIKDTAKGAVSGVAKEGAEEALQGGSGTIASDVTSKLYKDNEAKIGKGAGEAIGAGLSVGSLAGATAKPTIATIAATPKVAKVAAKAGTGAAILTAKGVSAVKKAAENAPETISKTKEGIKETGSNIKEAVSDAKKENKAIKTGDTSEITDPVSKHRVLTGTMKNADIESKEDVELYKVQVLDSVKELSIERQEIQSRIEDEAVEVSDKDTARYNQLTSSLGESVALIKSLDSKDLDSANKIATDLDTLVKATEATPEVEQIIYNSAKRMDSAPESVSTKEAKAVANSPYATAQQKKRASLFIKGRKAENTSGVSTQAIEGGEGNIGIKQHLKNVRDGVLIQDTPTAKAALSKMKAFVDGQTARRDLIQEGVDAYTNLHSEEPIITEAQFNEIAARVKEGTANKKSKGIDITDRTEGLMKYVNADVKALSDVLEEAQFITDSIGKTDTQAIIETADTPVEQEATKPVTKEEVVDNAEKVAPKTEAKKDTTVTEEKGDKVSEPTGKAEDTGNTDSTVTKVESSSKRILDNGINLRNNFSKDYLKYSNRTSSLFDQSDDIVRDLNQVTKSDEQLPEALQDLSDAQVKGIEPLTKFVTAFEKYFADIQKNSAFSESNYLPLLKDSTGNVYSKTFVQGLAVASYNWLTTRSTDTLFIDKPAVNDLLGFPEDTELSPETYEQFREAGTIAAPVIDQLGKDAFKLLGLSSRKDVPNNIPNNMENATGSIILQTLAAMNTVEYKEIPNRDFSKLLSDSKKVSTSGNAKTNFIRLRSKEEQTTNKVTGDTRVKTVPVTGVQRVINANKESDNLLDKLFNTRETNIGALLEMPTSVSNTAINSTQKLSKKSIKGALNFSQVENKFKATTYSSWLNMSDSLQETIAGYTDNVESLHVTERFGTESKNRKISKDIQAIKDFAAKDGVEQDTPFFFKFSQSSNTRYMMENLGISTQASKLHRALMGPVEHVIEVTDKNLDMFKISVGATFGMKPSLSLLETQYADFVESDLIQNAVQAVLDLKSGTIKPEQEQYIADAVKEMGEENHSFQGLVALAAQKEADGKPFTSELGLEVDGVTNGIILTLLQFPHLFSKPKLGSLLKKGGISFNTDTTTLQDYLSNDNVRDIYEDLIKSMQPMVSSIKEDDKGRLDSVFGELFTEKGKVSKDGRKFAKNPLLTSNYGAASATIISNIAIEYTKGIYKAINSANSQKELNSVTDLHNISQINFDNRNEVLLNSKDQNQLNKFIADIYGNAVITALNEQYGGVYEIGRRISKANAAIHAVYNFKLSEAIDKAKASKEGNTELTIQEITDIQGSLAHLLPSVESIDKTGERVNFKASEKVRNYGDAHKTQLPLKNGYDSTDITTGNSKNYKSYTSRTASTQAVAPGNAGLPVSIQSVDAFTIRHTSGYAVLPVHDAYISSIDSSDAIGKEINASVLDTMDYNIIREISDQLDTVISSVDTTNLNKLLASAGIPKLSDIRELAGLQLEIKNDVVASEQVKQELKDSIVSVDQYAGVDTAYANPEYVSKAPAEAKTIEQAAKQLVQDLKPDQENEFNSSEDSIDIATFKATIEEKISKDNILSVFDDLKDIGNKSESTEHSAYLKKLLGSVGTKLLDPVNLYIQEQGTETIGKVIGDNIYINTGKGTSTITSDMSTQEVYAHELVHSILGTLLDSSPWITEELQTIFDAAAKVVTFEHFMPDVIPHGSTLEQERDAAKLRWEHIFENTDTYTNAAGEIRNNTYHEFITMASTNAKFREILKTEVKVRQQGLKLEGNTVLTKIANAVTKMWNTFVSVMNGTINKDTDDRVVELLNNVLGIQNRKASLVNNTLGAIDTAASVPLKVISKAILEPLSKLADSEKVRASKSRVVNVIGNTAHAIKHTDSYYTMLAFRRVVSNFEFARNNILAALAVEIAGRTNVSGIYHDHVRKTKRAVEQLGMDAQNSMSNFIRDSFHTELSQEEEEMLSSMLIADVSSILASDEFIEDGDITKYTPDQLIRLYSDSDYLASEIGKLKKELRSKFKENYHIYTKRASSLASEMITGVPTEENSVKNAKAIANMFATYNTKPITNVKEATELLDTLVTLEAIELTNEDHKKAITDVMSREYLEDSDNGVSKTLSLHAALKYSSIDRLFDGDDTHAIKGYIPEITDPDISYLVDTKDKEEELSHQGYELSHHLEGDRFFYVNKDGIQSRYQSFGMEISNNKSKGTTITEMEYNSGTEFAGAIARDRIKDKVNKNRRITKAQNSARVTKISEGLVLSPIYNSDGKITDYRHQMTERNKRELLNKDYTLSTIMGRMAGTLVSKPAAKEKNRELVALLHKDFKDNGAKDAKDFVEISLETKDEFYKEMYRMIPEDMRMEASEVFGENKIMVRKFLVPLIMGQRKLSIGDYKVVTDPVELATMKLSRRYINTIMKHLGTSRLHKIEGITQEVIKIAKDVIVIKGGVTLIGNIKSNNWLLWIKGLGAKELVSYQAEGIDFTLRYLKDIKEIKKLEFELMAGTKIGKYSGTQAKIDRLYEKVNTNPIHELINEGMLQTIVEEIDINEVKYTYRNKLEELVAPVTDKIPDRSKNISDHLFMTHKTELYKLMRTSTQLSDFVARYALNKHNIEQGMTKKDSLIDIQETFINYDLPTHPLIQYGNDMGIIMFTKFYARIQKIILQTLMNSPARVLGLMGIDTFLSDLEYIHEQSMLTHSPNINTPLGTITGVDYAPMLDLYSDTIEDFK